MELPDPYLCRYLTNDFSLHLSKNVIICKKRKDSSAGTETIFKEYILSSYIQYKYILSIKKCQITWRYIYGKRKHHKRNKPKIWKK